jgi:hypothetical protein
MSPSDSPRELRHGRVWLIHACAHREVTDQLELLDADAVMSTLALSPEETRLEPATGRAPTRFIELGGTRLHLRRARHGGWLAPLWRGGMAGLGRMRAEFQATYSLYQHGAPVPEPVFAVGYRRGLLWEIGFATRHEADAQDGVAFLSSRPDAKRIVAAARAAGLALRAFHGQGARHADLNLGNLLVRERDDGVDVLVIDLDQVRLGRVPSSAQRCHELRRLARSLDKTGLMAVLGPDARRAFGAAYAGDVSADPTTP